MCVGQSGDKVELRLDADGRPAIANSCIHTVANELDAWQLLQKAMAKRSTKATSMNDRSSRSHCVITFRCVCRALLEASECVLMTCVACLF